MNKNKLTAGVDEVGRGSWIGPVFSAAVILKKNINKNLLKDSKKIPAKERKKLAWIDLKLIREKMKQLNF